MCSLNAIAQSEETLFDDLPTVQGGGLKEDLGRYIGFGQTDISDEAKPIYRRD